jgi:hypothetical protein
MKSGCVSASTPAAGRRLAPAYPTALANFGSQARQPSPCVPVVPVASFRSSDTPSPNVTAEIIAGEEMGTRQPTGSPR